MQYPSYRIPNSPNRKPPFSPSSPPSSVNSEQHHLQNHYGSPSISRHNSSRNKPTQSFTFEFHILYALINIRFPCRFIVRCSDPFSSMNSGLEYQNSINTIKHNVRAVDGKVDFDEKLVIRIQMPYNVQEGKFQERIYDVIVLLVSDRRPAEEKLVGRCRVNLVEVIQHKNYQYLAQYDLAYCATKDAKLAFTITTKDLKQQFTQQKSCPLPQLSVPNYKSTYSHRDNIKRSELLQKYRKSSNLQNSPIQLHTEIKLQQIVNDKKQEDCKISGVELSQNFEYKYEEIGRKSREGESIEHLDTNSVEIEHLVIDSVQPIRNYASVENTNQYQQNRISSFSLEKESPKQQQFIVQVQNQHANIQKNSIEQPSSKQTQQPEQSNKMEQQPQSKADDKNSVVSQYASSQQLQQNSVLRQVSMPFNQFMTNKQLPPDPQAKIPENASSESGMVGYEKIENIEDKVQEKEQHFQQTHDQSIPHENNFYVERLKQQLQGRLNNFGQRNKQYIEEQEKNDKIVLQKKEGVEQEQKWDSNQVENTKKDTKQTQEQHIQYNERSNQQTPLEQPRKLSASHTQQKEEVQKTIAVQQVKQQTISEYGQLVQTKQVEKQAQDKEQEQANQIVYEIGKREGQVQSQIKYESIVKENFQPQIVEGKRCEEVGVISEEEMILSQEQPLRFNVDYRQEQLFPIENKVQQSSTDEVVEQKHHRVEKQEQFNMEQIQDQNQHQHQYEEKEHLQVQEVYQIVINQILSESDQQLQHQEMQQINILSENQQQNDPPEEIEQPIQIRIFRKQSVSDGSHEQKFEDQIIENQEPIQIRIFRKQSVSDSSHQQKFEDQIIENEEPIQIRIFRKESVSDASHQQKCDEIVDREQPIQIRIFRKESVSDNSYEDYAQFEDRREDQCMVKQSKQEENVMKNTEIEIEEPVYKIQQQMQLQQQFKGDPQIKPVIQNSNTQNKQANAAADQQSQQIQHDFSSFSTLHNQNKSQQGPINNSQSIHFDEPSSIRQSNTHLIEEEQENFDYFITAEVSKQSGLEVQELRIKEEQNAQQSNPSNKQQEKAPQKAQQERIEKIEEKANNVCPSVSEQTKSQEPVFVDICFEPQKLVDEVIEVSQEETPPQQKQLQEEQYLQEQVEQEEQEEVEKEQKVENKQPSNKIVPIALILLMLAILAIGQILWMDNQF